MFYRETGQLVESYSQDRRMVPVREDRWIMWVFLAFMFLVVPGWANEYWFSAILIPMMTFGIATPWAEYCLWVYRTAFARYGRLHVFWCIYRI